MILCGVTCIRSWARSDPDPAGKRIWCSAPAEGVNWTALTSYSLISASAPAPPAPCLASSALTPGTTSNVLASNLPPEVYTDPLLLADAYADGAVLGTAVNLNPFAPNQGGPGDRLG